MYHSHLSPLQLQQEILPQGTTGKHLLLVRGGKSSLSLTVSISIPPLLEYLTIWNS